MTYDLTERQLDELLSYLQDGPNGPQWHSDKLVPAVYPLIMELRRRRGTTGPTEQKDRRNTYPRGNSVSSQRPQQRGGGR